MASVPVRLGSPGNSANTNARTVTMARIVPSYASVSMAVSPPWTTTIPNPTVSCFAARDCMIAIQSVARAAVNPDSTGSIVRKVRAREKLDNLNPEQRGGTGFEHQM